MQARIFHLPNRPPFMLVYDLAEFYEVKPERMMQQVRRNIGRFPDDFIFELTEGEMAALVVQNARPNRINRGVLMGFTKEGALQLSSVLTGPVADIVSVTIIRAFAELERQAEAATAALILRLRTEEAKRKPIRVQVMMAANGGMSFDAICKLGNYARWRVAEALRDCLKLGLIDRLPVGMPMVQSNLFGKV
ncbi:MAG: ORF6N domain-containing protein [Rhodobacter sp.]|nr:ORF6N domain-containing protein [Rhodobacter sp.]